MYSCMYIFLTKHTNCIQYKANGDCVYEPFRVESVTLELLRNPSVIHFRRRPCHLNTVNLCISHDFIVRQTLSTHTTTLSRIVYIDIYIKQNDREPFIYIYTRIDMYVYIYTQYRWNVWPTRLLTATDYCLARSSFASRFCWYVVEVLLVVVVEEEDVVIVEACFHPVHATHCRAC